MCIGSMLCGVFVWLYHSHLQINLNERQAKSTLFEIPGINSAAPFTLFGLNPTNENDNFWNSYTITSYDENSKKSYIWKKNIEMIMNNATRKRWNLIVWNERRHCRISSILQSTKVHNRKVYYQIIKHSINSITCIGVYLKRPESMYMWIVTSSHTHDDVLHMNHFASFRFLFPFDVYLWFRCLLAQQTYMCGVHVCM